MNEAITEPNIVHQVKTYCTLRKDVLYFETLTVRLPAWSCP